MKDNDSVAEKCKEIEDRYKYKEEDFPNQELFYRQILRDIYKRFLIAYTSLEKEIASLEKNENKYNEETLGKIKEYINEFNDIEYSLKEDYLFYSDILMSADIDNYKSKKDEKTKSTYRTLCQSIIEERIKNYKKAEKQLINLSDKLNNI